MSLFFFLEAELLYELLCRSVSKSVSKAVCLEVTHSLFVIRSLYFKQHHCIELRSKSLSSLYVSIKQSSFHPSSLSSSLSSKTSLPILSFLLPPFFSSSCLPFLLRYLITKVFLALQDAYFDLMMRNAWKL